MLALVASAQDDTPVNDRMPLTHVAVMVFPANEAAKALAASAQSRLEQILNDSGVEVSDREEAKQVKSIWKKLEDPGYFVTADDFVKNTAGHQLDGIVRVYLSADSAAAPGGYFSATAQADVRLVDENAKVQAQTSFPMGAPGRPPSDGLTAQAALVNAMQRAIDEAAGSLGLTVNEPASPRAMKFTLGGPVAAPAQATTLPREPRNLKADYVDWAELKIGRGSHELVTCTAKAPGGDVAAVGGSVTSTRRGSAPRGPSVSAPTGGGSAREQARDTRIGAAEGRGVGEREFGSRVHLVDVAQKRELTVFQTQEVGRKVREHRGSSQVLDCMFVHSWRYLAAVTGDLMSLWDTERGINLAEIQLPFGSDESSLAVLRAGEAYFLRVDGEDKQQATYRIEAGK
ncbi:MAG: hypothetical protein ACT4PK_04040 [Gammaproteobacteria bacterium]